MGPGKDRDECERGRRAGKGTESRRGSPSKIGSDGSGQESGKALTVRDFFGATIFLILRKYTKDILMLADV